MSITVELVSFKDSNGKLLPGNEMVVPCEDEHFVILINARLSEPEQKEAYLHAIKHIINDDFSKKDVQMIEREAHGI